MILLGSIQRAELISLIEKQTGRERRLQVAAKRQNEARIRLYDEMTATLRLDPPPASRVSLALPSPGPSRLAILPAPAALPSPGPSRLAILPAPEAIEEEKTPVRRPSRFEVVKAPEVFVTDTDDAAKAIEQQQPYGDPLSPSAIQLAEADDV